MKHLVEYSKVNFNTLLNVLNTNKKLFLFLKLAKYFGLIIEADPNKNTLIFVAEDEVKLQQVTDFLHFKQRKKENNDEVTIIPAKKTINNDIKVVNKNNKKHDNLINI